MRPREESNPYLKLRKLPSYPLNDEDKNDITLLD